MVLMNLEIVTPDRKFFSANVRGVLLKGPEGLFEILPRHTEYVAAIVPSVVKILTQEGDKLAFLSSGFVEVKKGKATIVTDTAEWPEEIDINRAANAQHRAEERLSQKGTMDIDRARLSLVRALARQKAGQNK